MGSYTIFDRYHYGQLTGPCHYLWMSDLPRSCHWSLIAVLDAAFRNWDRELHSQKEDSIRSKRFIFFPHRMILHTQRLPITTALEFLSDLVFLCTAYLLYYQKGDASHCVLRQKVSQLSDLHPGLTVSHPVSDWTNPAQDKAQSGGCEWSFT